MTKPANDPGASASFSATEKPRGNRAARILFPLALAVFCSFWAMRDAGHNEPSYPDESRHALNGALLHDLIRDHAFAAPVQYVKNYYSRLPALSLPYHPPLFPLFEAAVYSVLGVNYFAARLAVALAVFACCLLLYRLVLSTHESHLLAGASVLAFFAFPQSQYLASKVMLEFPSLVFVLAALIFLQKLQTGDYRLGSGLAFGVSAAAAVWTKQHSVFLAGVPFVYVALLGRWPELRRKAVWLGLLVLSLSAIGMIGFSKVADSTSNQSWPVTAYSSSRGLFDLVLFHAVSYSHALVQSIGSVATALFVASLACYAVFRIRRIRLFMACDIHFATMVSLLALLFVAPFSDERYLLWALPAIAVFICTFLLQAGEWMLPRRYAWALPAILVLAGFGWYGTRERENLMGPAQAAQLITASKAQRVIYCGSNNGGFIFAIRSLQPRPLTAVVRGDKLPLGLLTSSSFSHFLDDYGITRVVIETGPKTSELPFCDALRKNPPAELTLEREIPFQTTTSYLAGGMRLYRYDTPAGQRKNSLTLPSGIVQGGIQVELPQSNDETNGGDLKP